MIAPCGVGFCLVSIAHGTPGPRSSSSISAAGSSVEENITHLVSNKAKSLDFIIPGDIIQQCYVSALTATVLALIAVSFDVRSPGSPPSGDVLFE